jgi:hypothetical protein
MNFAILKYFYEKFGDKIWKLKLLKNN